MELNYFEFPGIPGVGCVFCGRADAVIPYAGNISFAVEDRPANVRANREWLLDALGSYGLQSWSECTQVHGNQLILDALETDCLIDPGELACADGMTTCKTGLGLMIKTADCQPILLTDTTGSHIMALHAGWRGNRINFPASAVRKFCQHYGLCPADLWAVRGPSLGPDAAEFLNFDTEWGTSFKPWYSEATRKMNLWGLTRYQLEAAGIPGSHVFGLDICTFDNAHKYFSYRRQKQTGRQASLIWIKSEHQGNENKPGTAFP